MTTMILTTIGILLAGATALMTIFYGDGSVSRGAQQADAAVLQNAGANVKAASAIYASVYGRDPADLSALVSSPSSKGALSGVPMVKGLGTVEMAWRTLTVNGSPRKAFVVSGVRGEICSRLNSGSISEHAYAKSAAAAEGSEPAEPAMDQPTGCFSDGGQNAYYTVL